MKRPEHWVTYECPKHGQLVETTIQATVRCKCGRMALMRESKRDQDAARRQRRKMLETTA